MVRRFLIVRGARTTDQLQQLGLAMAKRYDDADMVALLGNDGRGLITKGTKDTVLVEFFDADPSAGRCMRAVRRVKDAYEARMPSGTEPVDLMDPAQVVGMFLFFWPLELNSVDVVADGIERGDGVAVETAAEAFITTDFGARLDRLDTLIPDEQRDAGGHAADGAAG